MAMLANRDYLGLFIVVVVILSLRHGMTGEVRFLLLHLFLIVIVIILLIRV